MLSLSRKYLIGTLCLLSISFLGNELNAQKNGIGLRFGDPSGLSYKHYMGRNALEINFGRTHWFYGDGWYNNRFDRWYRDQNFVYDDIQFRGYRSRVPVGIQVHYLWQYDLSRVGDADTRGLDWYVGLGGQAKMHSYEYYYRYKLEGDPKWYYDYGGRVANIDIGADGVIGLEYTIPNAPISFFLDATLFVEVLDDPFLFHWQGGVGGRFNF